VATCPPLSTHPVLHIKWTVNGEFEKYETRIVAGGEHQEYGVNYTDIYAPVIEWTIVRLILYLSCVFSDEGVYVRTPRGIAGWPSRMKRLLKAMYRLNRLTRLGTLKFLAIFKWAFLS
jgi:hypothetical protein